MTIANKSIYRCKGTNFVASVIFFKSSTSRQKSLTPYFLPMQEDLFTCTASSAPHWLDLVFASALALRMGGGTPPCHNLTAI